MKYCQCGKDSEPRHTTSLIRTASIICRVCGRGISGPVNDKSLEKFQHKLEISPETAEEIRKIWEDEYYIPAHLKKEQKEPDDYKMTYFRIAENQDYGVVSVMAKIYDTVSGPNRQRLAYTVSICSPKDNFNKSIARELCTSDPFYEEDILLDPNLFGLIDKVNRSDERYGYRHFPMRHQMINNLVINSMLTDEVFVSRVPDFALKILLVNLVK